MAYKPTEKTQAHMANQRGKLINSATKIVTNEGFKGLTIAKVAQTSGLAVGSVYKHFNNKNHLLEQVFNELTERDMLLDLAQIQASMDAKTQMITALEQLFTRALMTDKLAYALFAEPLSPDIEQQRVQFKQHFKSIFSDIITLGINQHSFLVQPPLLVAHSIMGVLNEALLIPLHWQHQKMPTFERIKLIEQCQQFCLRSITYNGDDSTFYT